jgi:hypothetical protein
MPGSAAPAARPLDELSRVRLRRVLAGWLGECPTLDAHLALLDTRGAWYAEKAMGAWSADVPDSFFGLVRHVVRTQLDGPPPQPDIEGWLAAGRPADPQLAHAFDLLHSGRYAPARRPAITTRPATSPGTEHLDAVILGWPTGEFAGFVNAYAKLERVMERRHVTLPPIDA